MNKVNPVEMHRLWRGKYEITCKCSVETAEDLAVAYAPGVAEACKAIKENKEEQWQLTARGNQVAVITDGTAILGLGNIGPEAGMPVMEGKAVLFKTYGDINAIPLCLKTTDTEEIIKTIKYLEANFAGINLEDIAAPRCFEIETRLKKELSIPVFHDDQHGTAIVVGGALINALKLVNKKIEEVKVVINGAGAAGTSIAKHLMLLGVKNLIICDKFGIIDKDTVYENPHHNELGKITNPNNEKGLLKDALVNADVFVGVSAPNVVSKEMVKSMAKEAIVFPLANPVAEISYEDAIEAGAKIVGTGSSKHPNQVNNALVFPGLFRGAIDGKCTQITNEIMVLVSRAIASSISDNELNENYILPKVTNHNVHKFIANKVKEFCLNNK